MATKSFTSDAFMITQDNALKFRNIINNKKKVRIVKAKGHKKVKQKLLDFSAKIYASS